MALKKNTLLALSHLKNKDFGAYIAILAAIGADITSELNIRSVKQLSSMETAKALQSVTLDDFPISEAEWQLLRLHALLFARVWSKAGPHDGIHFSGGQSKTKLDRTTRRNIHFALLAMENIINLQATPTSLAPQSIDVVENIMNDIFYAINNFETKKQRRIRLAGKALAFLTSLAFGVLQTGVAIFFVGMMLFTPTGWLAMAGLLAGALTLGGIFSYVSYCTLKHDIPVILQEIIGKDKILQGFREYKNQDGKTVPFNKKQIAGLAGFSLLFALPSALATGAFSFTATFSIPTILTLFGITVASSAAFFPIGIAFAVVVTAAMALFMIRSFHSFIAYHNGNPISFLRRPFDQIGEILDRKLKPEDHPIANKLAKGLTYALTGLICALGVIGLVISSASGVNSVTALVMRTFEAPVMVANAIGIAIGGVISLVARLFFTVAKCGNVVVNLCKLATEKNAGKVDKFGLFTGVFVDLPLSALSWFDSFTRPPVSTPVFPMPSTPKYAVMATVCTSVKEAGVVVNSMIADKNAQHTIKLEEDHYEEINQTYQNKTASFVKKPETLAHFSLFKRTNPVPPHFDQAKKFSVAPSTPKR